MTTSLEPFAPFAARMRAEGLPPIFIATFAQYYSQLRQGSTGLIAESEIDVVPALPDAARLPAELKQVGQAALARTAAIKLNGGLGTSMGLSQAKSLLVVKQGLSFLDITARQVLAAGVPLILMNSFATHEDSLQVMRQHGDWHEKLPLAFLQHKQPKVNQADLSPARWPADPSLEWCPPGHGDMYAALVTSGTLDALLQAGYEYAFVSNSDNLGAVIDQRILGYFVQHQYPFMMEVADRTEMDKKGGHLAYHTSGQLILRELAQTPADETEAFQDIRRHKYFNTNNLWLNLVVLQEVMDARDNILGLPMIRNRKTVDPRDEHSPTVYQLETAVGSAIGVFEGAQAIRVPRSRFAPVKKSDDLLAVRSDAYVLTENHTVILHPQRRDGPPLVELDPRHYRFVSELDQRFPHGAPSLLECLSLEIRGDFRFGRGITCQGDVRLVSESDEPVTIPDGTCLTGEAYF